MVLFQELSFLYIALESKENEHYATLQAEQEAMQMMKSQVCVGPCITLLL